MEETDDFFKRIKALQPEFQRRVIPDQLLPYLNNCLTLTDEETVVAQQNQSGPIHAAGILFQRLIRREGCFEYLVNALKHQEVGLKDLAEKFEKVMCTIPVRWDIVKLTDNFGTVSFNPDHCQTHSGPEHTIGNGNQFPDETESSGSLKVPLKQSQVMPQHESLDTQQKRLEMRREEVKLNVINKIFSLVEKKEEIPVAIEWIQRIGLVIEGLNKGSILFNISVITLEDLRILEDIWQYGVLKQILDLELMDTDIKAEIKMIATNEKHEIHNIMSAVLIHDTDLARCRSWLMKSEIVDCPVTLTDSVTVNYNSTTEKIKEIKKAAKYVKDRLPECLAAMTEDTFVASRIDLFYLSDILSKKMYNENEGIQYNCMSVSTIFINWLVDAFSKYIENNVKNVTDILIVCGYILLNVLDGKADHIQASVEAATVTESKINFQGKVDTGIFGKLYLPLSVDITAHSLQSACQQLSETSILFLTRNRYKFRSKLLQDYVTLKILHHFDKEVNDFSLLLQHFHNMPQLIAFDKDHSLLKTGKWNWLKSSAKYIRTSAAIQTDADENVVCCLKETDFCTPDFFTMKGLNKFVINQDILLVSTDIEHSFQAKSCVEFSVDLSEAFKTGKLKESLIWLNILGCIGRWPIEKISFYPRPHNYKDIIRQLKYGQAIFPDTKIRLMFCKCSLDSQFMQIIDSYFNATVLAKGLIFTQCNIVPAILQHTFSTGHFRNVTHLSLADNNDLAELSCQLNIKYLPEIDNLEVQNCLLGDTGIRALSRDLKWLKKITKLNIANNKISAGGLLELVTCLQDNTMLREIRLQNNPIGIEGSRILSNWIEKMLLLEVINISDCNLKNEGIVMVGKSLVNRSLKKMSARSNSITGDGAQKFFTFLKNNALEHIDFSQNKIFNATAKSYSTHQYTSNSFVEFIQASTYMTHISLWNCEVGHHRIFRQFKNLQELTYLCLQANFIADNVAEDIAAFISQCHLLEYLNLRQNNIRSNGARALALALQEKQFLKDVLLDRNEIDEVGGKEIALTCIRLPKIKHLELSYNHLSEGTKYEIVSEFKNHITSINQASSEREANVKFVSQTDDEPHCLQEEDLPEIWKQIERNQQEIYYIQLQRSQLSDLNKKKNEFLLNVPKGKGFVPMTVEVIKSLAMKHNFIIERREAAFSVTI